MQSKSAAYKMDGPAPEDRIGVRFAPTSLPIGRPPCLAERKCQQRGRDFADLFRNQYVLSRDANRAYPGWTTKVLNGWALHHGPAIDVQPILDTEGTPVGFLLGHALTADSTVVQGALMLEHAQYSLGFSDHAEAIFTELAGRYLAVLLTPDIQRLYADPVCDLPVLFDADTRTIGSSLGLVLDRDIRPNPQFPAKMVLTGQRTLGLQNTLDASVKRLVSNHYLDLNAFSLHRHWPSEDTIFDAQPKHPNRWINRRLEELAARLGGHISALAAAYPCIMPVTGGRDSRMLMACGRDGLKDIVQFCGHRFHNQSRRDIIQGRRVVRSQGYGYTQYFKKDPTETQMRDMRLKMGWSGTRGELAALAMIEEYPQDHMILRGNIMELLRANQWRYDGINAPINAKMGLRRLKVSRKASRDVGTDLGQDYVSWMNSLPDNAKCRAYDFAFVEHYLPNVQGPYITAMHRTPFINPFNDRRLIEIAISMPTKLRKDGAIVKRILGRTAPELLDMPFV